MSAAARARRPFRCGLLVTFFASACATTPPMPPLPATHPASPLAAAAPERPASTTLQMPAMGEKAPAAANGAAPAPMPRRGH